MKTCKKCKNEYKDEYSYCPKCGEPCDDSVKRVKTPGMVGGDTIDILKMIGNIILYILGGLFILAGISDINSSEIISSIFLILSGLSLFQIFYKIIEDKGLVRADYLKIARIVLPIVLFIVAVVVSPADVENNSNDSSKSSTSEKTKATSKKTNNQTNKKKTNKVEKKLYLKGTKGKDFYNILCDVGNLTKKEPTAPICGCIEYAADDMNYMIEVGANEKTDEIAYISIMPLSTAGDPTNFFMTLNRLDYNGKNSEELTNFIKNGIGKETEKTIGDLKFSTWVSTTTNKTVLRAETPDFEEYMLKCDS